MSEWQPIETAPKDGTWILVYGPESGNNPYMSIVKWTERSIYIDPIDIRKHVDWEDSGTVRAERPTHWMPLPDEPEGES